MGTFFCNMVTRGPTQDELIAFLSSLRREAIVTETARDISIVFDAEFDRHGLVAWRFEVPQQYVRGMTGWEPLARDIAIHFACTVLAIEVYDSDIFYYQLYEGRRLFDEYILDIVCSGRSFLGDIPPDASMIMNNDHARLLCTAFGAEDHSGDVAEVLSRERYGFEEDRRTDLMRALGFPFVSYHINFASAEGTMEEPEEAARYRFKRTNI